MQESETLRVNKKVGELLSFNNLRRNGEEEGYSSKEESYFGSNEYFETVLYFH